MSYWPVSDRWAAALTAGTLRWYCYADFYEGIGLPRINNGPVRILSGSVQFDSTAAVRRVGQQIMFTPETDEGLLVPSVPTDLLFPDGTEIVPQKGFIYDDGTVEVVPQGRLLMENVITDDTGASLTVTTDGYDRMATLARNTYTDAATTVPTAKLTTAVTTTGAVTLKVAKPLTAVLPFIVYVNTEQMLVTGQSAGSGNMTVTAANRGYNNTTAATHVVNTKVNLGADSILGWIIQDRLPGVPMSIAPSKFVLTATPFNLNDDPSTLLAQQALAAGMEVYLDQVGTFVGQPVVDPSTQAVTAAYAEGDNATLTELSHTLTNQGIPNWIIVVSQGSGVGTPIRAQWQDNNPNSPTYINGSYPTTVQVVTTALVTSQGQAQAMANALGAARLGTFDAITMSYLGDPAHDAGDVVTITRDASLLSQAPYVMQKGTLELDNGSPSSLTGYGVV